MGESKDSPPVSSQTSAHNEGILFDKVKNVMAEIQTSLHKNIKPRRLLEESQNLNKPLEDRMNNMSLPSACVRLPSQHLQRAES